MKRRDERIDVIRGGLLALMTIVHFPHILRRYIYEALGYVSEAEGFVFVSGYVAGLHFIGIFERSGISSVLMKALKRVGWVYFNHILLFGVLLLVLKQAIGAEAFWDSWRPLFEQNVETSVFLGMLLLYQPRFMDILPMYCVFLLSCPLIIIAFAKGLARYVLCVSALVWLLAQYGMTNAIASRLASCFGVPICLGGFDLLAWQLLFVIGLFCGYLRGGDRRQMLVEHWPLISRVAFLVAGCFWFCRHFHSLFQVESLGLSHAIQKPTLGLVRVVNFAAIVVCGINMLDRINPQTTVGSWLRLLGRHSLPVFGWHIALVTIANLAFGRDLGRGDMSETLGLVICLSALFFFAWALERWQLQARAKERLETNSLVSLAGEGCPPRRD